MIAKQKRFEVELAAIRKHYPEGLVVAWKELPIQLLAGAASTLHYQVENRRAGHLLPTGDPERFLLITARIRDSSGVVLSEQTERIGAVWEWAP